MQLILKNNSYTLDEFNERFLFFQIRILDISMDSEKDIPMEHTRKMKNLLNLMLFFHKKTI